MKKTSTVQLVRNATLKIRYAGHTMLIDPVLADKGTLISALGVNKTPGYTSPFLFRILSEAWTWCS